MGIIFGLTRVSMLSIFIFYLSLPPVALSIKSFDKLPLPPGVSGPESLAFNFLGGGPYTGVFDGRILKYQGPSTGFADFAFTSPNRSKASCDGTTNPNLGPICGRPLGLDFNYQTGELYIADAYIGLLVAGPNGRLATLLATGAEGVPFRFLNGLGVDPLTGDVYFTDFSSVFQLRDITQSIYSGDATGRLLKYDRKTKQVTVLVRGLSGATGAAVSSNGAFVLVSEATGKRIQRFWLKGPKSNTAETFITFQGMPDNIKRTILGNFMVALNVFKLPSPDTVPTRIEITPFGTVLQPIALDKEYNTTEVSEVQEIAGAYYIGSPYTSFVGVYKIYKILILE